MNIYTTIYYRKSNRHAWNICGRTRVDVDTSDLARQVAHIANSAPGWTIALLDGLDERPILPVNFPVAPTPTHTHTGTHTHTHAHTVTLERDRLAIVSPIHDICHIKNMTFDTIR